MNVWNAVGGAPDLERMRAAYREAHPPEGAEPPEDEVSKLDKVNCPAGAREGPLGDTARARALALAQAELDLNDII